MKQFLAGVSAVSAAIVLVGCAHEKNADYRQADFGSRRALKSHYHGAHELSDADVLGINASAPSEEAIRATLDRATKVELKRGEPVVVLQSGAKVPDTRMVNELNKHYRAIPFTGIRSEWIMGGSKESPDYAKALRLAAAQAGAEKILCFWGSLEVARHDLSTKTVTWLPVIDVILPDQKDNVRVHLKMALVDVRSGAWTVFRTEPVEAEVVSTGWGREHLEPAEIKNLKEKSYQVAVNSLVSGK